MEYIEVKLPDGKKKVPKGATLEEILGAGPGKEGPMVEPGQRGSSIPTAACGLNSR